MFTLTTDPATLLDSLLISLCACCRRVAPQDVYVTSQYRAPSRFACGISDADAFPGIMFCWHPDLNRWTMQLERLRMQIDKKKKDSQKGTHITRTPQGIQFSKLAHRMCYPSTLDYYFYDQPQYPTMTAGVLLALPMFDACVHIRIKARLIRQKWTDR